MNDELKKLDELLISKEALLCNQCKTICNLLDIEIEESDTKKNIKKVLKTLQDLLLEIKDYKSHSWDKMRKKIDYKIKQAKEYLFIPK